MTLYRMQVLGSFDIVKSEMNFEGFDDKTAEWCLAREFARQFSDWSDIDLRNDLIKSVIKEDSDLIIRRGNVAIKIIDKFETYKEGYGKGYLSETNYISLLK